MSLNQLPRMDAAHIDESGDIQFFTADGREGVITELGSTLIRSTRLGGVNVDALTTEFELPEYSYSEPTDSKPDDYYAAKRSGGHVSKLRK